MLPDQCTHLGIPVPNYFHRWINIQNVFQNIYGQYEKGSMPSMRSMLKHFHLSLDGTQHSGIDDSKNIAKILIKLLEVSPFAVKPT